MSVTINDAIAHLHQVAVIQGRTQSPNRLSRLADLCIQELGERNLFGATKETIVPGIGRDKKWDIAWPHNSKIRLAISLKSLLKNLAGAVPNRIDDLMGEVANVQLNSPEIVVGYIMIIDRNADNSTAGHGRSRIDFFRSRVDFLSRRKPPAWTTGMIEAYVVAEVDFTSGPRLVSPAVDFDHFFDQLAEAVRQRNPDV